MTSFALKTVLAVTIAFSITLFSVESYAKEVESMYGITKTKFDNKPTSDEYIQLNGTTISKLDKPSAKNVRIEVVKHKELNLFFKLDRARPNIIGHASQGRQLARKQEGGFTVSWAKSIDAKKFLSIFGSSTKFYSGAYYAFVDTTGDKKANRVYKLLMKNKKGKESYMLGFAEKEDGSEITSSEAAKKVKL